MLLLTWCFTSAVIFVAVPGIVWAADLPPQLPAPPTTSVAYTPPVPDWIVTIGLEGRIMPAFPGASNSKLGWSALPLFSIRKEGTPPDFFAPRDSFGFDVINFGAFQ